MAFERPPRPAPVIISTRTEVRDGRTWTVNVIAPGPAPDRAKLLRPKGKKMIS